MLLFSVTFCNEISFEGFGFHKSETYAHHLTYNAKSLLFPPPSKRGRLNQNVNVNIAQTIPNTHTKQSEANPDVQISSQPGRRGRRPATLSYHMTEI